MHLKEIKINNYKLFNNEEIKLDGENSNIFSIVSINGGGKSTLLQFIFILLHCFMDDKKKQYILNLLGDTTIIEDENIAEFKIENNSKEYYLKFIICQAENNDFNFNEILDLDELKDRLEEFDEKLKAYDQILTIQKQLKERERISPLLRRDIRSLERYIKNSHDENLFDSYIRNNDVKSLDKLLVSLLDKEFSNLESDELDGLYNHTKSNVEKLRLKLKNNKTKYITHLINNLNVLTLRTNMNDELLKELTESIYLNAPNSQMFLFLRSDDKELIFNRYNDASHKNSYTEILEGVKEDLSGFYTYDFTPSNLILKSFMSAFEEDRKVKLKTNVYGTHYDKLKSDLNHFLEGKTITVDENLDEIKISLDGKSIEILPEDLSHGELKKLSLFIWLKYIVKKNSIVLMDEVDIALHPRWQSELVSNLKDWGNEKQFLLATHSPQILNSTYYKNIITLGSKTNRLENPPIDRDLNSIISTIMGAPYQPKELVELHNKYRELALNGSIEFEEAKKLKKMILEQESINSSFFQELKFDLDLMQ